MPKFTGFKKSDFDEKRYAEDVFGSNSGPECIKTEDILNGLEATAEVFGDDLIKSIKESPYYFSSNE